MCFSLEKFKTNSLIEVLILKKFFFKLGRKTKLKLILDATIFVVSCVCLVSNCFHPLGIIIPMAYAEKNSRGSRRWPANLYQTAIEKLNFFRFVGNFVAKIHTSEISSFSTRIISGSGGGSNTLTLLRTPLD